MTFPQKTKWLKRPIGWEDLGQQKKRSIIEDNEARLRWTTHTLCNTAVKIGKEDGELFQYCPMCLVKLEVSI